jgi:uncharacterized protein with NAD-binding domain and iron-sulfur cluster
MNNEKKRKSRKKIAVLGGGIGAMSAVFALTSEKNWYDKYQITIYQQGWRLGGKGASGRNKLHHDRIEEHGLHMWWGFYDHAFSMMKQCCDVLGHQSISDLFIQQNSIGFVESISGKSYQKTVNFPRNNRPLGSADLSIDTSIMRYAFGAGCWLKHLAERLDSEVLCSILKGGPNYLVRTGLHLVLMKQIGDLLIRVGNDTNETATSPLSLKKLLDSITSIFRSLVNQISDHGLSTIETTTYRDIAEWLRKSLCPPMLICNSGDYERRWYYIWLDFLLTSFIGLLNDDILSGKNGFDSIDDEELSSWLLRHGANSEATIKSVLLRGLYDAAFCFIEGNPNKANISAGVALNTFIRMFLSYNGSYMWRMTGGMGDVIFAPLYQALVKRGQTAEQVSGVQDSIRFEFFHRVEHLGLSTDKSSISTILVNRQATLRTPCYQPFQFIGDQLQPVWPSEPLYEQLMEGNQLQASASQYPDAHPLESTFSSWPGVERRVLASGVDFDCVILGIPIGALPYIGKELIAASERWREMISQIKTIRTQATQIWLSKTPNELGWQSKELSVIAGYADPLNSLADMSHVLTTESWPQETTPASVVYFCGPMPDDAAEPKDACPDYPGTQVELVRQSMIESLEHHAKEIWPLATDRSTGDFDWNLLIAPPDLIGPQRLRAQYIRANIDPSERYVLAVAGTTKFRIAPGESGFTNLFVAGDWTYNKLNFGCVESAAQSGYLAACAVKSGTPTSVTKGAGNALTLPHYRQPFSEQVFQPPYLLSDATFQMHLLTASPALLQQVCDKYLNNIVADWTFQPIGSFVVLMIGHVDSNRSIYGPEAGYGDGPELSAAISVPVFCKSTSGSEIGLFPLFAIVDNSLSMATGREVFGFSKQIGWFQGVQEAVGADILVETQVFEQFSLQSRLTRRPLFRVSSSSAKPPDLSFTKVETKGMLSVFPQLLRSQALSGYMELLRTSKMAVFNLLQVRAPEQPGRAQFQTITRSVLHVTHLHGGGMLPPSQIELFAYDSHPLARDILGLAHKNHTITPLASMWLRYDAHYGAPK